MIGVVIIAVVFTSLAALTAYMASKGGFAGLGDKLATETKAGKAFFSTTMVCVYFAFGIAVPLIFIIGNHSKSNAAWAGVKLTASEQVGRELFGERCGICHTLAADNAIGQYGPNLDTLKPRPTVAVVLRALKQGCTQTGAGNTECLGYGTMPAQIFQGQNAKDVAEFVAAVAGRR